MKEITFIHTADLHLDSPFLGLSHLSKDLYSRIQESTFTAFKKVIDTALDRDVDFLIIVGDLFDGEDRSIKAQARLRKQLERLQAKDIAVFISHGNHDHLSGNWLTLDFPANTYVFGERVEMIPYKTKSGITVHLYGFSYPERHVMDRKVIDYEKLAGADLHIGLLHGQNEGEKSQHHPYAPFSINELQQKGMDYWALGHIHKTQILHTDPPIIYPGNIQGRHRNETGKKGCYEVKLSLQGECQWEFIETADIRWESCLIELQQSVSLTELYTYCLKELQAQSQYDWQGKLLEIKILNAEYVSEEVKQKFENGEFLEMLQDQVVDERKFVWPYAVTLEMKRTNVKNIEYNESFLKMIDQSADTLVHSQAFDEAISGLFSHKYGSRYVEPLNESEKEVLSDEAIALVIQQLEK
ncbi:DNA repair exonuclease [Bacillus sp. FJAT-50079]|uniref:metallophosphoesterase family protein n=1 Tax=Bacillus sp. FJAT-50079 TaxID=2833577 RepID=UPI001BCA09F1|nr:DNA repair exonuclease [Bacillus sp. FJAT-50079]MBS4210707.1 DNA repair exonuclease [Bacillus sp. FJAT-50079]